MAECCSCYQDLGLSSHIMPSWPKPSSHRLLSLSRTSLACSTLSPSHCYSSSRKTCLASTGVHGSLPTQPTQHRGAWQSPYPTYPTQGAWQSPYPTYPTQGYMAVSLPNLLNTGVHGSLPIHPRGAWEFPYPTQGSM